MCELLDITGYKAILGINQDQYRANTAFILS